MTASARRRPQPERRAFACGLDAHARGRVEALLHGRHLTIGAVGVVVEKQHGSGTRAARQLHWVLDRRVPEADARRQFAGGVLRVVDEQVDAAQSASAAS